MGVSWRFSEQFHFECGSDQVIIRSQWGQLVPSIVLGACYIAGLVWIMKANGMLSAPHWDPGTWAVVSVLISVGPFIMLPRRLTVSFDARTRKAVRVYEFAFGLITRRCEIPFDTIACVAVQNKEADGEAFSTLAIRQRNDDVISLAMKEGSHDEVLKAAQAISSATGIALEET
jgi:hypothetical protein